MSKQKTHNDFVVELGTKRPDIKVLESYTNSYTPIKVQCLVCSHIWAVTPHLLLRGSGCPNCAKSKRTRSQDQFIEELKRISPNIRVVGEFKGTRSSVAVECTSCGNKWSTAANNLLRGSNCVVCMRQRQTKTHETFEKEVFERLPTITLIGKYTASNKKIAAKCNVCGHQWEPFAGNLRKGEGCPKCALIEQGNRNRKTHDAFVYENKLKGIYVHTKA